MIFPSFPWPMLSNCSQSIVKTMINLLFKVFSHIMTHKICVSVYFFTGINWFSDFVCCFSLFDFLFFACSFSESLLLFHDFSWRTLQSHDFRGLENEIIKFHDFPGFPWPVRTLLKSLLPIIFSWGEGRMTTSGVGPAGPSGLWLSRALCTSWRSSNSFPVACNLSDNKELRGWEKTLI